MKKILFIFSLILILVISLGNDVEASYLSDRTETNYTNKNGLMTSTVTSICQTSDGYIWIGQYAGLTMYDSQGFELITELDGVSIGSVTSLAANGTELYIGTQNGIFVMNSNDSITELETDNINVSVKDIKVYDGTAFFATNCGLYRYKNNDKKIVNISNKSSIYVAPYSSDNCYYVLDDNTVWSTESHAAIFSDEALAIKSIAYHNNELYLGTTSGYLYHRVLEDDGYHNNLVGNEMGAINDLLFQDDILYIGGDDGLFVLENDNLIPVNNLEMRGNIENVMVDYEGNIWLASSGYGVSKITKNTFYDYFFDYNIQDGVNAIVRYNGLSYIAGENGLYIIDDANNELINNELTTMLTGTRIRSLAIYKDKLYIATYDSDLYDIVVYDFTDGPNSVEFISAEELVDDQGSLKKARQIRYLLTVGNYLYIATNNGISRYDGQNFLDKTLNNRPLYLYYDESSDRIYMVLEDAGISYTNVNLDDLKELDSSLNSSLKCLSVDGGLLFNNNNRMYYYKDNKITPINYNFIGSITEIVHQNNKYIIGTDTNIYVTDDIFVDEPSFLIYDYTNGLKSNLLANSSGYYDAENNLYYFTTTNGIYVLNFDHLSVEKIKRKLSIDSIYGDDVLYSSDNIVLDSGVKRLSIYFSVLSFINDQHYKVYYKLEGVDKFFHTLESNETFKIDYTNISGGNYKLVIYTEDFDGTLSYNTIELNIGKDKTLYEYPWFWVLIGVSALILIAAINVFIIHRRSVKSRLREAELKGITIESIEAIARTIDAKDTYTNGHSIRVGYFSRIIGEALGMSGDELENLYYTALLHDIGKIGIPDAILNKPGRLTNEEFDIMKTHTTRGAKILDGISTIPHIVEGAKYHHEKYGGGGYPDGLVGEDIPYIARIICCADCYDAMATRRVYKEPYPKEKILEEFERCKNIQFDPKIANVVIDLIKNDKLIKVIQLDENKDNN